MSQHDWPHRQASRFVSSGGLRWHLQDMGEGPVLVMLHGTGASTHSWAGLAPLLARSYRVLAIDLPGHGFSSVGDRYGMSLPGMASLVAGLLDELDLRPALVVGHSAGAAVLVRMCLDCSIEPAGLVSINGALLPLPGLSRRIYPSAARLLASLPVLPQLVARHGAQRLFIDQLIRQTGSSLSQAELEHYRSLVGSAKHVNGTIQMMANWNLDSLERELPGMSTRLFLIACRKDKAVPFTQATRLKAQLPLADLQVLPDLGHLGHEENPALFAKLIGEISAELGLHPA